MTDLLEIPPGPSRCVWVFAIDLPPDQAEMFAQGPVAAALGVTTLEAGQSEYVDADTFADYGFSRYLAEGQGVDAASLTADAARLDALRGPVLLVFRPGLGQGRLAPRTPLRLIGRYDEVPSPLRTGLAPYDAEGDRVQVPQKKRPSEAAMSGRVATVVLIFLTLFVIFFVWSAG